MTPMQEYITLMAGLGFSVEELRGMPNKIDVYGHDKQEAARRLNELVAEHGDELREQARAA